MTIKAKVAATIDFRKYPPITIDTTKAYIDLAIALFSVPEGHYLEVIAGNGERKCFRRTL